MTSRKSLVKTLPAKQLKAIFYPNQYNVTRKGDSSGIYYIPVTFQFTRKDGRFRLAKAQANKNVKDLAQTNELDESKTFPQWGKREENQAW